MTWQCKKCGNEDYCPYIDVICYKCGSDKGLEWVESKITNWRQYMEDYDWEKVSEIVGVASGYFNPLHKGHIEYLNESKKLCNKLIVIVNSDKQVKIKGSHPFMNEKERMTIVGNLKAVDAIVLSIDEDGSVCKTLAMINPDLFFKGGDKHSGNVPENITCEKYGIKLVSGMGKKIQSSSNLIAKTKKSS